MTDPAPQAGVALTGTPIADWPVLSESIHQVSDDGEIRWVRILLTADEFRGLPADLGMKIAELIRQEWPS